MPPIFDVSELMRLLDSLCYITSNYSDGLLRVCEDFLI